MALDIQRNTIIGLFVLLPLWITIYFAYIIFILLAKFSYPLLAYLPITSNKYVMYIVSFFLSLTIIYMIGVLTNMWLGKVLLNFINNTLKTIPVIGSVYKSIKQLAETFNSGDKGEQKVVAEAEQK